MKNLLQHYKVDFITDSINKPLKKLVDNLLNEICQKQYDAVGYYSFFYKGRTFKPTTMTLKDTTKLPSLQPNLVEQIEDFLLLEKQTNEQTTKIMTYILSHFYNHKDLHGLYFILPESCHHILDEQHLNKSKAKRKDYPVNQEVMSLINYAMLLNNIGE